MYIIYNNKAVNLLRFLLVIFNKNIDKKISLLYNITERNRKSNIMKKGAYIMYKFKIGEVASAEELLQMKLLYDYEKIDSDKYYMKSKRTGDRYVIEYNGKKEEYSIEVQRKEKGYQGTADWKVVFRCNNSDDFEILEVYRDGEKVNELAEIKRYAYVVFCVGVLLYNKIVVF